MPGEVESDVDKEVSDYDDEDDEGELVGQFDDGNYVGEEGTDYSVCIFILKIGNGLVSFLKRYIALVRGIIYGFECCSVM